MRSLVKKLGFTVGDAQEGVRHVEMPLAVK